MEQSLLSAARTVGGHEVDAPDGLDLQGPGMLRDEVVEAQEHAVQHAQLGLGRQKQELLALQDCAGRNGATKKVRRWYRVALMKCVKKKKKKKKTKFKRHETLSRGTEALCPRQR